VEYNAGSAFYPTPVSAADLSASYDVKIGPGKHADGLAFVLADPSAGSTALGGAGWRLGYGGVPGVAVTADTHKNSSDPSNNFVGVATGDGGDNALTYVATSTAVPQLRVGTHRFVVTVDAGLLGVVVDGVVVIPPTAVVLPDTVLLGFSAGTGSQADRHAISNVVITTGAATATAVALRGDASPDASGSPAIVAGGVTPVTFCVLPRHAGVDARAV
jgi:hypothetical protein